MTIFEEEWNVFKCWFYRFKGQFSCPQKTYSLPSKKTKLYFE